MIHHLKEDLLLLERYAQVETAPDRDIAAAADRAALRLMALGAARDLREILAQVAIERRSLPMRMLGTDIAVRAGSATLHELEALEADTDAELAAGGDDYRWWAKAIRAEYLFWDSDPLAFNIAAVAAAEAPVEEVPSTPVLVGRGRLKRIAAIGRLFTFSAEQAALGWTIMQESATDLRRAGWEEERALTIGVFSTMWTVISFDDVERSCAALDECVYRLRSLDSDYTALALVGRAMVHFVAGDLYTVQRSLDEAVTRRMRQQTGLGASIDVFVAFIRNLAACLPAGPSTATLEELDGITTRLLAASPERGGSSVAVILGMVMADLGRTAWARRWANAARHSKPFTPYGDFDRQALEARLDLLEHGDAEAVDVIRQLVEVNVGLGLTRWAGIIAIRAARDCDRIGLADAASDLRALGTNLLPGPDARTLWEALLCQPLRAPGDLSETADEIRLLSPDLVVRRKGRLVKVPAGPARLLTVLAAEHRPITIDRLADLLWPDIDISTGRNRLNVVVHRLRKALDLGPDELIRRTADGIEIDPRGKWRIDAWEFRELANGDREDRLRALRAYRSDLCARQFAYDDAVEGERRHLQARWVDLASRLVAEKAVDPTEIARRLADLDIHDPALSDDVAAELEARGHTAEAALLRATE